LNSLTACFQGNANPVLKNIFYFCWQLKILSIIAIQIFQKSVDRISTITKAENSVTSQAALTNVQSGTFCFDITTSSACRWQSLYWRWRS